MALEDLLGTIAQSAGGFFQSKAQAEAAAASNQQTNSLAAMQQQAQINRDVLNAQTSQKTALYVALGIAALAVVIMFNKRIS